MTLHELVGSRWAGTAELWLDPLGDVAATSPCVFEIDAAGLGYTWAHDGVAHRGSVRLTPQGGDFTDSFHSPSPMACVAGPPSTALFDLRGSYAAGEGPPWGWRLVLALRPPYGDAGERLVFQMTNIAPWGEEARAVRMIVERR